MPKKTDIDLKDKDSPEWTESAFRQARLLKEDYPDLVKTLKRGRPKSLKPKEKLTIRLDSDIVEWLRSHDGYNAIINDTLRGIMRERT